MSGDDYNDRVTKALDGFYKSKSKKKRVHNQKPEKVVEKIVMQWLFYKKFSVDVYESRARWDPRRGRYAVRSLPYGHSDIAGVDSQGNGTYIELKAPGRLSSLREGQREFLLEKIKCNAFAVVVDDVDSLERYYNEWFEFRKKGDLINGREYLMAQLPRDRKRLADTSEF